MLLTLSFLPILLAITEINVWHAITRIFATHKSLQEFWRAFAKKWFVVVISLLKMKPMALK